jgi:uncharacterized protein YukE
MQQIRQDPQKLRDFCDQLNGHASYWQSSIGQLETYMSRLGQTWQDEQFNEFGQEVTQLKSSLDEFAAVTRTTISELQQDAERLEEYYQIQNEV